MGRPAAKKGDQIVAVDTHVILIPTAAGTVPTPLPHPFSGVIDGGLSADVNVMGQPVQDVPELHNSLVQSAHGVQQVSHVAPQMHVFGSQGYRVAVIGEGPFHVSVSRMMFKPAGRFR